MKKIFFLLALNCFLSTICRAQNSPNGPIIKYKSINSELSIKSDTLKRKYYFKYDINIQKDERVLIKYISPDYAVSVYARNIKGDTLGSVEIPKYFTEKGSHLAYLFTADAAGKYQFLFTSKDSMETGKYSVHLATFNPVLNAFDDSWEFCQKMDYIAQHSATDFQFLVKGAAKGFSLTNTRTTDYYMDQVSKCEIEYFTSDVYVCTILENINLEKCIQKMKELDFEMKKCITPEWKVSEKRREDVREMNRERFAKELDYKLTGKPDDDHNVFHEKNNLKYSVRFLIEKNLSTGYDFKIILE